MNKWEDSFKKSHDNNQQMCNCTSSVGLFVPNRQLSFIVAALLFVSFFIFMAGYFLGKKNAAQQFIEKVQKEGFADEVYSSVIASATINSNVSADDTTPIEIAQESLPLAMDQEIVHEVEGEQEGSVAQYYAQLIGFGTEKAAQGFVNKLAAKGIDTTIKKRGSSTVKGRVSYWYQVVTSAYSNRQELALLVDKIAKEENIKGACIRSC